MSGYVSNPTPVISVRRPNWADNPRVIEAQVLAGYVALVLGFHDVIEHGVANYAAIVAAGGIALHITRKVWRWGRKTWAKVDTIVEEVTGLAEWRAEVGKTIADHTAALELLADTDRQQVRRAIDRHASGAPPERRVGDRID